MKLHVNRRSAPSSITFIRHGQSVFNVAREASKVDEATSRCFKMNGQDYNTELTELGRSQAIKTGQGMPDDLEVIFASPYTRAYDTAKIISVHYSMWHAVHGNIVPIADVRLREKEYGIWNCLTTAEMDLILPFEGQRKRIEHRYWYRPIAGESIPDVQLRLISFWNDICLTHNLCNIVIVSHALTILAFRGLLEDWSPDEFAEKDCKNDVINCAETRYVLNDRFVDPFYTLEYENKVHEVENANAVYSVFEGTRDKEDCQATT